jgi:hypothetical protein
MAQAVQIEGISQVWRVTQRPGWCLNCWKVSVRLERNIHEWRAHGQISTIFPEAIPGLST